jgi:hypothetical protein
MCDIDHFNASAGRSSFDIVAAINCRTLGLMYSVPVTSLGVLARGTGDHLERAAQHVHQLEDSLLSTVDMLRGLHSRSNL